MNMMIEYPNAGITIDDTLEEATRKASEYLAAQPAETGFPSGIPTSYKEWQLAGSPGTYEEWLKSKESGILSQAKLNRFAAAGVPESVATQIQIALNRGATLEQIRQELAKIFGKEKGYGYLDRFMEVYERPSEIEKMLGVMGGFKWDLTE